MFSQGKNISVCIKSSNSCASFRAEQRKEKERKRERGTNIGIVYRFPSVYSIDMKRLKATNHNGCEFIHLSHGCSLARFIYNI